MPRKVLIVDDNVINRQLLIKTLGRDYDALEAANGKEALLLLHRHYKMLSAVLLDIVMPEMDGYEVLRLMRDNVLLSQIPVIMVTGSEDEQSRVKALSLGANDFILKPFNPDIVKHCLKNNIALRETASILNAIQKDKLTGLFNREAFFEKVEGLIADRAAGFYVLSCFDIDNFKLINDQYGAAEGDRILREVGKAVGKNVGDIGGIAGRISADNFAALFPAEKKMTVVLQKILSRTLVNVDKQAVSFSIGRYVVSDLSLPASAIYDRAFIAKQSVKGRYDKHLAYFDAAMLEKLVRDQQITGEMELALHARQFEAWFQPQYNHATGALLGAEALARWRHPVKGIIPPVEFIPLFEQNGFVYELDKYIWREVCLYLRKWLDKGFEPLPVSVNISRYDIFRADLIQVLSDIVGEYHIPVHLLRLEITESAFNASSTGIVSIVKQLIGLGFTVEIDDFGSGYSSLNTLKNVPAQVVKLDMRFLDGGDDSRRGGNILESIVRMTKWLGMTVLAEGVEEVDQADFLKSIGCTYVQGYLYARPMPAQEYESLLADAGTNARAFSEKADSVLFRDDFWDPQSMDSMVFNKYSGGACIFEVHAGRIEMVRITDKYVQTVFGEGASPADAMRVAWDKHLDEPSKRAFETAVNASARTGEEASGEYRFVDLPGCPGDTYLYTTLRVIAATDDRQLVYCTGVNTTPQRKAEARSRSLARQLQAIMDNVNCGITAITYHEGAAEYFLINNRYFELLGYTRDAYRKNGPFSHIYAEDRQRVMQASRQLYESGGASALEYRAVKCGGEVIWLRDAISMMRLPGMERPVQLSIATDITAERQAARELLDNLPGGAALFAYDGKTLSCVHVNKRYWELVNRAPMDYAGKSALAFIHPQDRRAVQEEIAAALSQGRDIACVARVRQGRRGYRAFRVAGHAARKAEGLYVVSTVFTPVSEETASIQKMLPVALQGVMDASTEVSFVKDGGLRYISCSRRFIDLIGLSDEKELLGKTAAEVFAPELAGRYDRDDREILRSARSLVDFEAELPSREGRRQLLFSKYPLLDERGAVLGIYGTGRDVTEARQARSRLELLTNNIPGGIAVYEGRPEALDKIRLAYFSDGFCRLFGYTRAEYERLAAVNPLGLVFAQDISDMYKNVIALARDNVPLDVVYRARVNGGGCKWINVKAVMGQPNGENLTVNAVFFDVTEQRAALDKLRVSEEVNRLALQQSKSVVCRYDIPARRLLISPNCDPIFEAEAVEEDVPERIVRLGHVSPETLDAFNAFYGAILRGEKSGEALYQKKSTLGWRWVKAHFTTIFADTGEPAIAVITFADVTENMERDAAYSKWRQSLRDRQPALYALYHCNLSKNTILDAPEGQLLADVGRAPGERMPPMEETFARYAQERVLPEDGERFLGAVNREALLSQFERGKRAVSLDYRERLPDGGARWLRLTADLTDSRYSADAEAHLLFEDIDEAKRAELDMIERAENDPLTGVLNRAAFAQKVTQAIACPRAGARHALLMLDIDGFKLVNDFFGHGAGDQALTDIAALLRACTRRGDLVGRLGGDEFLIFLADISGEQDAARKARQICDKTRRSMSLDVQISGSVGIAMYPQDGDAFETLYKKADEALYSVKGAGKDTYAFYGKAVEREEKPRNSAAKGAIYPLNVKKRRMLIVDDSKMDCELLANLFKDAFVIEKAHDGASALVKLHHYGTAISVVLLDLMMPGMDGFQVLEKMRGSAETQSVPVVVVSGANEQDASLRAIRAGASDFVTKPIDPDVLRIRVQSAVSKTENERLRAQNSFLEMQSNETNSYKTVLDKNKTFVIVYDWVKSAFTYDPAVSRYLWGQYGGGRSLWGVLLSDMVASSQTVRAMQQLAHDVANDRERMEGRMTARLKSADGVTRAYEMSVYKQTDDYGLTEKLILSFAEAGTADAGAQ